MNEAPAKKPISVLVHDLNNALSPATLLTDLMLATEMPEEKRLEYIKRIQKSVAQAKTIIGEIENHIASNE